MQRLYKNTGLYFVIMLSISGANIFSVGSAIDQSTLFYPHVRVGETNLSRLSISEAREALLANNTARLQSVALDVFFADRHWVIQAKDIDLTLDDMRTAQTAFAKPRQGNVLQRFIALHNVHNIAPVVQLNQDKLDNLLWEIAKEINTPAVSASMNYINHTTFTINPSVDGVEVDLVNSSHAISHAILSGQASQNLFVRTVRPLVTDADLKQVNGVLSSYETQFIAAETARTQNIALAVKSLNGVLLRSGDMLSFNSLLGPRTQQRGYQKAPAFDDNADLIDDWGGGICQVSSTLYNSALMADLTIVDRTSHYRPVGYVPMGFDATVDFDSKLDLKIKNTLPHPVYIMAEVEGNNLKIRLLGDTAVARPQIQLTTTNLSIIEPSTVIIQDASFASGKQITVQKGQNGFQVSTARIRIINGEEQREHLADDTYKALDKVIRIGTKVDTKK